MADILINQLPASTPLITDLLILANPNTGIAKKSTVTQLNSVLTLAKLSDVTQGTPPANSILEWDGSFSYITNVVRGSGATVGFVPTFSATSPVELSPSILKETAYGLEISEDQYINNASVLFGLSSITKGFVMPKMTSSDRTGIASPLKGLEVFDTTLNIPYFYNGSVWKGVQEVLVSATNIKTINGTTILGSGNLTIASGITTLNTLTASTQTFATSTSGTDFTISSATSTHTFNLPTASASTRGLLSSANWTTFNNKIDGNGTTNYLAKFTASGTIGDSQIIDNGSKVKMGTNLQLGGTISDVGSSFVIDLYNSANYRFQTYNGASFLINPLANGVIIGGNTSLGQNLSVYNGIATDGTIRANDLGLSSNNFRFTFDTDGAKIQSYASKPLILNSLGNTVLINRTTTSGFTFEIGGTVGVYGSITTTNDIYSGKDIVTNNGGQAVLNSAANVSIKITTTNIGTGVHTTSGNHLPIIINGVTYWLALLNPVTP
jgi:hypothetical protein